MNLLWIYSLILPFCALLLDCSALHIYGGPVLQTTFLSILILALSAYPPIFLVIPLFLLGLFSLVLFDNFIFIFMFTFPIIATIYYSSGYFCSKITIGTLFYALYLLIIFIFIPLFMLKLPILPSYTLWAFGVNLVGASLSLKLLPIVE
ncbi:hypothetical protein K9K77_02840 [Candidatus Babeliales bacterium]|nr:hypothetical protein [Candidatus Babeliales bacterium]